MSQIQQPREFRKENINTLDRGESGKTISRRRQAKIDAGKITAGVPLNATSEGAVSVAELRGADDDDGEDINDATADQKLGPESAEVDPSVAAPVATPDKSILTSDPSVLQHAIAVLVNRRKPANRDVRHNSLALLLNQARARYSANELAEAIDELTPVLIKIGQAQQGDNQSGARLALQVIAAVAASTSSVPLSSTAPSFFALVSKHLRNIIQNTPDLDTKTEAIYALGATGYFGRASPIALRRTVMPMLTEIVSTDGGSIEALDHAGVVTAAQQAWALLATRIRLTSTFVADPMEAFVDQLDSSNTNVQIAAGQTISLVFEQVHVPRESHPDFAEGTAADPDDGSRVDKSHDIEARDCERRLRPVFPAYPPRLKAELDEKVKELAGISSKSISAHDRKRLHDAFNGVANSVIRHPGLGPFFDDSTNKDTGEVHGNRKKIILGDSRGRPVTVKIEHWWQLVRLQALRRILGPGLPIHFAAPNEAVTAAFDSRPPLPHEDYASDGEEDEDLFDGVELGEGELDE